MPNCISALACGVFAVTLALPQYSATPYQTPVSGGISTPALTPFEAAAKAAYLTAFGETIERPATYDTCGANGQVTTTAYLERSGTRSRLLTMYLSSDGKVQRQTDSIVLTPAGTLRVLVVMVRYPETVTDDGLAEWKKSQAQVNEDHRAFARKHGYAAPLVVFSNTNLVVDGGAMVKTPAGEQPLDPFDRTSVQRAVVQHKIGANEYDLLVSIDMNPNRFAGGRSLPSRFIHVGNYFHRTTPLTAKDWMNVARAAYHHEVAHQWGWPGTHDWGGPCNESREPFIVPPMLFGWEDVDGDGVPEILDSTPYGRTQK